MKSDRPKSVTLEDLLRLKRAERPPAEFWNQFERELRAKQLAALVVKRPWWRTLPARAFAGFSRYHLPLGATAVLAITFLSVREYQTVTPEGVVLPVLGDEVFETSASFAGSAATVAGPAEGAFLGGEVKPVAVASESAPSVSREVDMSTESGPSLPGNGGFDRAGRRQCSRSEPLGALDREQFCGGAIRRVPVWRPVVSRFDGARFRVASDARASTGG